MRVVGLRLARSRWRRAAQALALHKTCPLPEDVPGPGPETVALATALATLPLAQRQALVLHHLADLSVAAVAAELGVPEGTVKARLSRGRAALALLLTDDLEASRA